MCSSCNYLGEEEVLLIYCRKLPQGVTKHLQTCQKLQCPRAKLVYLFDMSQVCMALCVTSIQGWYHVMCNIHFLNIIYYPPVINDTGLKKPTSRSLATVHPHKTCTATCHSVLHLSYAAWEWQEKVDFAFFCYTRSETYATVQFSM
jgi:hypothetical protein